MKSFEKINSPDFFSDVVVRVCLGYFETPCDSYFGAATGPGLLTVVY